MPDFTYHTYYHCASAEYYSTLIQGSKGNFYKVEYGPSEFGNCEHDWSCNCESFKFRKKCRHIEEAKRKVCGWMQFTDGDEPVLINGKKCCPKCHDEVIPRVWAV